MAKTMNEAMAVKVKGALSSVRFYAASYTKYVYMALVTSPAYALKKFFGLGDEYVPFNMEIRKLVLKKYKEETGHPLYDEAEVNKFPEDLVMACDSDIVILKYIEDIVKAYLLEADADTERVIFLLGSEKENNVAGGLSTLQVDYYYIDYFKKMVGAILSYFKSQLEMTKAGALTTVESFDKTAVIKELFALTDELAKMVDGQTNIFNALKAEAQIYTEPAKLLENRPTIEYVAKLGVFKMPAALKKLYEYDTKLAENQQRYEKLEEQLKARGLDPKQLIDQRATLEAAWKIMAA